LPEAQLDRFLLLVKIGYPTEQEEFEVLNRTTGSKKATVNAVINAEEILQAQALVRQVTISDDLVRYVSKFIRATRPDTTTVPYIKEWVRWGAGPRAGQALILTAKARALLKGRYSVLMEDLHAMATPVLRHRILLNFKAEAEDITTDMVTAELIKVITRESYL
jgi:MoxR-like ATPase